MTSNRDIFHDYLNLKDKDYSNDKFIVFYGNSWAWKSSYIEYLLENNTFLSSNNHSKIEPHIPPYKIKTDNKYIFIDEFLWIKEYLQCFHYFFSSKQLLIASHLPKAFFLFLGLFWKIEFYNLNNHPEKITKYLDCLWYKYSEEIITQYIKKYHSTYTDIDIIIEESTWNDFDKTFEHFHKSSQIKIEE